MTKTVSHLLDHYGRAKWGELWNPRNPDQWLDDNEGETLRTLIEAKDASNPETARLLNKLGNSLFADKWRPYSESAEAILGKDGVEMIRLFIEEEQSSSLSMGI